MQPVNIVKTTLALALIVIATPVLAEWVKISETSEAVNYLDPSSIRKDGQLRRVWSMQDLKARAEHGELSRRALGELDCKEERTRYLSLTTHSGHMATGKVLRDFGESPQWEYPAPGTLGKLIFDLVCSDK